MSVTFTPKQSWIALIMFAALLLFSVYNASLNIGLQNVSDQRQAISDQRAANATKERQLALIHTNTILQDISGLQKNITVGLEHNSQAIQNLNFTHQQILSLLQNRSR
jgi:hypothetical protein